MTAAVPAAWEIRLCHIPVLILVTVGDVVLDVPRDLGKSVHIRTRTVGRVQLLGLPSLQAPSEQRVS